jgi:CheY-like chemotaxis protein
MTDQTAVLLLVEDNPDDAAFFDHSFKKTGLAAHLHIVADGVEALSFLSAAGRVAGHPSPPKVIVLDLKLPKVDGLQVLQRLRADPRNWNIPVVVFSSSREELDLAACYRMGVNSYVVKSMDFDQFNLSVRQICEYWLGLNQTPHS